MIYVPPAFVQTDPALISDLIARRPLGTLITYGAEGLSANHTPFLLDRREGEQDRLIAHIARNNPLWRDHDPAVEALVVFQGPSAYISPSWYPSVEETHQAAPTYNYVVVQAYGPLIIHEDEKWLRGVIGRQTKVAEADNPHPWKMGDTPPDYLKMMIANTIGVEIPITRLIGKWKTSQNRPEVDRRGVIDALSAKGDGESLAMANLIRQTLES